MSVTLTLTATNPTTGNVTIELQGDGCAFELTATDPLNLNGAFAFTQFQITQYFVSFSVPAATPLTGTISLPVGITSGGGTPQIMINNISGGAQASWPTKRGPGGQALTPGNWLPLDGYIGEQ